MEFGLSQEQTMLQDSLARFLGENGSLARSRRFAADKESRAQDVIDGIAELGVTGLIIPEDHGGVGLSLLEAALVSEVLGANVTPAPFVGSSVLAPLALMRAGDAGQQGLWLPKLASGAVVAGVALSEATGARDGAGVEVRNGKLYGRSLFVLDFEADVYIVADRSGGLHLAAADAAGLTRNALRTIDLTRPTGELRFDGVSAEPLLGIGAAQAMLDQAVAYAKERKQFDRPIATFQAVKHMCAEMAAALEPCRALVWYAGHALDHLPTEASITACHAKAHLSEVGTQIAKTATEVHGGMGFTDLVGLHYWFKRIGFNRQILGGPQSVREDAARLKGLAA